MWALLTTNPKNIVPKLSIITVNLNNLTGLQKTMESVFEQTFNDYEYIIIDGGSTDGSKEYIQQHDAKLTYWTSESDAGMYDAMNKGIQKAKGEYLMFLNGGDFIVHEHILANSVEFMRENPEADIYYGNMEVQRGTENVSIVHPPILTLEFLARSTINHQAAFIKKSVFTGLGLYDLNYRYAADHAFFMKALVNGMAFRHIPFDITYFELDGVSSRDWEDYASEMELAREKEIPEVFNER